jgi:hypothetical protein
VFAGKSGLGVLACSKYVIMDGTFELVEEKLVLTTLMGYHDGIAILCTCQISRHMNLTCSFFRFAIKNYIVMQ